MNSCDNSIWFLGNLWQHFLFFLLKLWQVTQSFYLAIQMLKFTFKLKCYMLVQLVTGPVPIFNEEQVVTKFSPSKMEV